MPDEETAPFFSVLILNWHSFQHLPRCLSALENQTFKDFEVLLLDNGNEHPIRLDFARDYPRLNLSAKRSETNLGFTGGNNLLAKEAKGKYLVLLNADAFPLPTWLAVVQEACDRHPDTFFASRLIKEEDHAFLDGEWDVYHALGFTWRHNHNQSLQLATNETKEVFGACAAAVVYPREAFEAVGGFDEDFFAYMEDVDLDFRLQLAGYKCLYLPEAVVLHVGSASTAPRSDFAVFHGHRNLPWVFVKNMPGWLFWLLLPGHILINLLYLVVGVFMGRGKAMFQAKAAALRGLPKMWKKRNEIQKARKVSIGRIAGLLTWNPFAPLVKRKH